MTKGYDPDFLGDGIHIPLPGFDRKLKKSVLERNTLRENIYSDHIHFTLVMNRHTRQLIYAAQNIDRDQFRKNVPGEGKKSWRKDSKIGTENQLGNDYYKDREENGVKILNPYDKGHMAMRFNNMWGGTPNAADLAGKATFIYGNAALQHMNLNRDEWRFLEENIVREFEEAVHDKLTVFTGPIFGDLDRHVVLADDDAARAPAGFFKVVCYRSASDAEDEKLGVFAFAIFQDATILRDKRGRKAIKTDRRYQVTISELQEMTRLDFGTQLFDRNPLFFFPDSASGIGLSLRAFPERIPIHREIDIVLHRDDTRSNPELLAARRVVITAAMIDPKGDESKGEWIALFNRGARKVNLKGWWLEDAQGRTAKLTQSIGAGETLVVKGRAKGTIKLSNQGGSLFLRDDSGQVADHANWTKFDLARVDEGVAYMFEHGQ